MRQPYSTHKGRSYSSGEEEQQQQLPAQGVTVPRDARGGSFTYPLRKANLEREHPIRHIPAGSSGGAEGPINYQWTETVEDMPRGTHDPLYNIPETQQMPQQPQRAPAPLSGGRPNRRRQNPSRSSPAPLSAIPDLVALLALPEGRERKEALHALSAMAVGSRRVCKAVSSIDTSIPYLVDILHCKDPKLQYEATGLLGQLAQQSATAKLGFFRTPGSFQSLVALLSSTSVRLKAEALTTIARLTMEFPPNQEALEGVDGAVEKIAGLLSSSEERKVQCTAAQAVQCSAARNMRMQAALAGVGTVPALVVMLASGSTVLQFEALSAIAAISDGNPRVQAMVLAEPDTLPRILCLMESPVADVQLEAINTLGVLGGNRFNQMTVLEAKGSLPLLVSLLLSSVHAAPTGGKVANAVTAALQLSPTDHFGNATWSPQPSGSSSPDTETSEITEAEGHGQRPPYRSAHMFHYQSSSLDSIPSAETATSGFSRSTSGVSQSMSSESVGRDFSASPSYSWSPSGPQHPRSASSSSAENSTPPMPVSYTNPLYNASTSFANSGASSSSGTTNPRNHHPSPYDPPEASPAHSHASSSSISFPSISRMVALPGTSAKEADIQSCTASTIHRLTVNNSEAKRLVAEADGALPALVALLASQNEEVRQEATSCIQGLELHEKEIRPIVHATVQDFLQGLVGLLQSLDEEVQCEAASAIGNFANGSSRRQRLALSTPGILAGLSSMLGPRIEGESAQATCVALISLQHLVLGNKAAQTQVAETEGLLDQMVALLMTKYSPVQIWTAGLLADLARDNGKVQLAMAQVAGLLPALLEIAEQQTPRVAEWALRAVKEMVAEDVDAQRAVAAAGFIPTLVEMLDSSAVEYAVWILAYLASQDAEVRQAVAGSGCIAILSSLLPAGTTDIVTSLHEGAAHALEALALNADNQREITTRTTVMSLLHMLKLPPATKEVRAQEQAAWTLQSLTEGNPDGQELIRRLGGVGDLRALLASPQLSSGARKAAKQALTNFREGPRAAPAAHAHAHAHESQGESGAAGASAGGQGSKAEAK